MPDLQAMCLFSEETALYFGLIVQPAGSSDKIDSTQQGVLSREGQSRASQVKSSNAEGAAFEGFAADYLYAPRRRQPVQLFVQKVSLTSDRVDASAAYGQEVRNWVHENRWLISCRFSRQIDSRSPLLSFTRLHKNEDRLSVFLIAAADSCSPGTAHAQYILAATDAD
jgi:hypothetical protein